MNNLRQAAQQALEALEQSETTVPYEGFGMAHREAKRKHQAAITALQAALAEPEQEPVAWMDIDDKGQKHGLRYYSDGNREEVPLFTAPTPRKPLTDEEIEEINRDLPLLHMQAERGSVAVVFARAIERAHGIGESK